MDTLTVREFTEKDIDQMIVIWNFIVEEGNAFPQEELLTRETAIDFFGGQTFTGVAVEGDQVLGLYILHPNNIGRCGHISNASYAVKSGNRGKKIGYRLVTHSMETGKKCGFSILQFNAVVATNKAALALYENIGFTQLGVIPGGFRMKDGSYEDIIPQYIEL